MELMLCLPDLLAFLFVFIFAVFGWLYNIFGQLLVLPDQIFALAEGYKKAGHFRDTRPQKIN